MVYCICPLSTVKTIQINFQYSSYNFRTIISYATLPDTKPKQSHSQYNYSYVVFRTEKTYHLN